MKLLVIDIESNALLSGSLDYSSFPYKLRRDASLWCIVITDAITRQSVVARQRECTREWLEENLKGCTHLIGHNILKFDLPMLKLFGILDYTVAELGEKDTIFGNEVSLVDTLLISRLFNPDRFGGHSLESWGERLGVPKTDFRQVCIDQGYITRSSPKGAEFQIYSTEMVDYCIQDTVTNVSVFVDLIPELKNIDYWLQATQVEKRLAHLSVNRENLGFWFDKKLAVKCVADLQDKMETIAAAINPILPPKPRNKGELQEFMPPKLQIKQDGGPTAHLIKFVQKIGATLIVIDDVINIHYKDGYFPTPVAQPLELFIEADINNLDHVKMYLISLGWSPTEWKERDLTRDSKKVLLPYDKRVEALERWYNETMGGKYRQERLELVGINPARIMDIFTDALRDNRPVKVPTSPCVRVGVEKDLCPNLTALGASVAFANDFTLYLTYKHRKNCIAGGDIEDMDFDLDAPNTGYLSNYREQDQRVPTPAIEVGAATFRYKHISVANVPRATSIYGKEMRSLFGSGPNAYQFGFDFSSLEARIMGHYVIERTDGIALAESMLAEKPYDFHSLNAVKLNISRSDAKSFGYGIIYGASAPKLGKMLGVPLERASELYSGFWEGVPGLKELRVEKELEWENNAKQFITTIDGRKLNIRSKHSILNALFQSSGVIFTKYVTVLVNKKLEELGYNTSPFNNRPDICSMIEYHDECQYYAKKDLFTFKTFEDKDEAKEFVANWKGEQLSTIVEGKKPYVTMPNILSKTISEAIKETEVILNLKVSMAMEYAVHNTWYGCH
jgi:hypothetical protein